MRSITKEMVTEAIKSGINMKFIEFLKFIDIKIENNIVDKLFHNINLDIPIYMSSETIEYFGYSGSTKHQKLAINTIIDNNFKEYKNHLYWIYDNDQYDKFLIEYNNKKLDNFESELSDSKLYPEVDKSHGKNNTNHLIIMPEMFKEMLMLCNTDKGKQVRKYYIKVVDALHLYIEYQNKMTINTLENKLDKVLITLDEERKENNIRFNRLIGIAEDAKTEVLEKIEELTATKTILTDVSKNHVEIDKLSYNDKYRLVIVKEMVNTACPFYVIRRQNVSIERTIQQHMDNYNVDLTIWLDMEQPNPIAFYKIIKRELNDYMITSGQWFGLRGITEEEFKNKIDDINIRMKRE